ncbi:MAG TPA: hypothetical protein QF753_15130 [Victivallales bacterium]|nr:hypothetical protein [Victivallales bacterium]
MSFLKKSKQIKKAVSDVWDEHHKSIKLVLKDNFSSNFLSRFKRGEIIISEEFIRHNLEKALLEDNEIFMEHLICSDANISIGLLINKFSSEIHVVFRLHILRAKINNHEQRIIFDIKQVNIKGRNFLGKILISIIKTIVSGIFRKSILPSEIADIIKFDTKDNKAYIELNELEIVRQKAVQPLPCTSRSLFELISVSRIIHSNVGLVVKCKLMSS